mmetsp:Transcript_28913/g.78997  ORF Transcript_28913/g.78997 Transcript_28913/m.78997 type:complete len:89 (+) Transcript_28913:535-801(+)
MHGHGKLPATPSSEAPRVDALRGCFSLRRPRLDDRLQPSPRRPCSCRSSTSLLAPLPAAASAPVPPVSGHVARLLPLLHVGLSYTIVV